MLSAVGTNVGSLLMWFCGIHPREISQSAQANIDEFDSHF